MMSNEMNNVISLPKTVLCVFRIHSVQDVGFYEIKQSNFLSCESVKTIVINFVVYVGIADIEI